MAKKASKKSAAKPAAPKKTAGKAPASTTKVVGKSPKRGKPVVGSPDHAVVVKIDVAAQRAVGLQMMQAPGEAPFTIPTKSADIIKRAIKLNQLRDSEEVELSALLWTLEENSTYTEHDCVNIMEFAESKLMISASKARTLVTAYRRFLEIGLHPKMLAGPDPIDYNRFKALIPGINAQLITPENIAQWVPKLRATGPDLVLVGDLKTEVKNAVAEAAAAPNTAVDPMKSVSFPMAMSEIPGFNSLVDSYRKALGVETQGEAIIQAMNLAASSMIEDDQQSIQYRGLVGLSTRMAQLAPVAPIIVPLDSQYDEDNLGTIAVRSIYSSGGRMCLSGSLEAAAEFFGVAVTGVTVHPCNLAADVMPKVAYAGPRDVTETVVDLSDIAADGEVEIVATAEPDDGGVERTTTATTNDGGVEVNIGDTGYSEGDTVLVTKGKEQIKANVLAVEEDHLVVRDCKDGAKKRKVPLSAVSAIPASPEADEDSEFNFGDSLVADEVPPAEEVPLAGKYAEGRSARDVAMLVRQLLNEIVVKTGGIAATQPVTEYGTANGIKTKKGEEQRLVAIAMLDRALKVSAETGVDIEKTIGAPTA